MALRRMFRRSVLLLEPCDGFLQLIQLTTQFRKPGSHRLLSEELAMRDGGQSHHIGTRLDITEHSGHRPDDGTITDFDMPGNTGLACDNDAAAKFRAAGNADLGNDHRMFADDYVMCDLNKIVDLDTAFDPCAFESRAVYGLKAYLAAHADHLNYAQRLKSGQSIGSGQVEGACKNMIGRRLKQTGARWRVRRVNRMAGLCANLYSKQWNHYWNSLIN